jgi:uncharacterized transporter YbjL
MKTHYLFAVLATAGLPALRVISIIAVLIFAPAIAFACNIASSDAPTVSYATVYPLTTLLRILAGQILVILLFR